MLEKIVFASIEPTNICNLDCITCSRSYIIKNYRDFRMGSIDERFLENVKKILPDLTEIKFHGLGEPLLATNAVALHKKMRRLYSKADIICVTNAAMPNLPVKIKDYVDHIIISVDHAERSRFEGLRRKADYGVVLGNILKLTKARSGRKTKITINSVFNLDTYRDIYQIIILSKALNVLDVRFNLVQDWVEDKGFDIGAILLDKVNIDKLTESILYAFKTADILGINAKVVGNQNFKIEECLWSRKMIYVTKDGQIAPCCMRTEPRYYFGSFLEMDFNDIWHGEKMEKFRKDRIKKNYPEICNRCPYVINATVLKKLGKRGVPSVNDFIRHKYLNK